MSRIASLSIAFTSDLEEARRAYDEFAQYVEGRRLKIPVEWEGPSSGTPSPPAPNTPGGAPPRQTFGGLEVPFPVAPFTGAAAPASITPTAAGPIQQATAPVITRTLADAFSAALGSSSGSSSAPSGWKLHLATDMADEVSRILKDAGVTHKVGRSSGQEGKDVTAYVGSRDDAERTADIIQRRAGHLLKPPGADTLADDVRFTPNVYGRFDARSPQFHQYGAAGIPFLAGDMDPFNRRPTVDAIRRADAALRQQYGAVYAGSQNQFAPTLPQTAGRLAPPPYTSTTATYAVPTQFSEAAPQTQTAIAPPLPPRRPPSAPAPEDEGDDGQQPARYVPSRVLRSAPLTQPLSPPGLPPAPPPPGVLVPPGAPGGPPIGPAQPLAIQPPQPGNITPPPIVPTQNTAIGYGGNFGQVSPPAAPVPSGRAFGYIRPIAAAYIAIRGVRAATEAYDRNQELNRVLATGPLEQQLDLAASESREFSTGILGHARNFLGNVIEGAGTQFGSAGVRSFGQSLQFSRIRDDVEEQRRVFQTQQISDLASRRATSIQRQNAIIGTTGFTRELRDIEAERNDALTENSLLSAHAHGNATAGIDQERQAILDRARARRSEVIDRARDTTQDLGAEVGVNRLRSLGLDFGAQLAALSIEQGKATREFTKSIEDLPQGVRGPLVQAFNVQQQTERQAVIDTAGRQERAQATGVDLSAQADELRQGGQSLASALADIAAKFQPVLDTLDKSSPEYTKTLASVNRARDAAQAGAVQAEQRAQRLTQGTIESLGLQLQHQPLAAALAEIRANTEAQITGVAPIVSGPLGIPVPNSGFFNPLQIGALQEQNAQQRHDEQVRLLDIGITGERESLQAQLARNPIGARAIEIEAGGLGRAEELRQGGFNDQAVGVLKNAILSEDVLKQNYLDAFRGQAIDLRSINVQNARDVEDPAAVLNAIQEQTDRLERAINDLKSD